MSIILGIYLILTLGVVSYIITFIVLLTILILIHICLKKYNIENIDYELLMIALFSTYLIFQSILFTKNDRYFITVMPFIAYYIINALNEIFTFIKTHKATRIDISKVLTSIIIIFLIGNTLVFAGSTNVDNSFNDIEEACTWMSNNQKINNNTTIYSDNWPATTWYLNIYTNRGVPESYEKEDLINFANNTLYKKTGRKPAQYFIDTTGRNKKEYIGLTKIKTIGKVTIYKNKYLDQNGLEYLNTTNYNRDLEEDMKKYEMNM